MYRDDVMKRSIVGLLLVRFGDEKGFVKFVDIERVGLSIFL